MGICYPGPAAAVKDGQEVRLLHGFRCHHLGYGAASGAAIHRLVAGGGVVQPIAVGPHRAAVVSAQGLGLVSVAGAHITHVIAVIYFSFTAAGDAARVGVGGIYFSQVGAISDGQIVPAGAGDAAHAFGVGVVDGGIVDAVLNQRSNALAVFADYAAHGPVGVNVTGDGDIFDCRAGQSIVAVGHVTVMDAQASDQPDRLAEFIAEGTGMPAAIDILDGMPLSVKDAVPGGTNKRCAILVGHTVLAADRHIVGTAPGVSPVIVNTAHVQIGSEFYGFAVEVVGAVNPGSVGRAGNGTAADIGDYIIGVADDGSAFIIGSVDNGRQAGQLSRRVNVKYAIIGIVPGHVNRAVPDTGSAAAILKQGSHGYICRR